VDHDLLWTPDARWCERTTLERFRAFAEGERGAPVADGGYEALWRWSVSDLEGFWSAVWDFFGVVSETGYGEVLGEHRMPGARWFPGARLNYAAQVFAGRAPEQVALWSATESGAPEATSWSELRTLAARIQAGLRAAGVERGDRVVAYLPNCPEAVAALLACAGLGAIWSSCSPDFGARGALDRFAQIGPKVLLACDGYRYGGRAFDRRTDVLTIASGLDGLEHTVVVPALGEGLADGRLTAWEDFLDDGDGRDLELTPVAFEHPLWVLYSSGTTGPPKAIVQGHGGIVLEHLKALGLHGDVRSGDRVLWFTTTGWMMWNFLVGALLVGAEPVLYDGSPGHPDLERLWDVAEAAGVTCFGTSPGYVRACARAEVEPRRGRSLSRLRAVGVTGSPLPPEGFDWVYTNLGPDVWLFSMSGGTDVCTAFVGGVPTLPVRRGELQGRALGAAVSSFDAQGEPLVGEVGELVITKPMPSMPLGFWGDDDGSRYRASYFEDFPGVWRHGDWIEITEHGSAIITGRSDATINRGGIRMGTSEIYRAVLSLDEVLDALVVDVPRPGTDGWMPLFVVLAGPATLDDELRRRIRRRVHEHCSPRHVPDEIIAVPSLPRTATGKTLEVPVKRILAGASADEVVGLDALADPAALEPVLALAGRIAAEDAASGSPS
jgi:acetoacetyl-CoA synthetase